MQWGKKKLFKCTHFLSKYASNYMYFLFLVFNYFLNFELKWILTNFKWILLKKILLPVLFCVLPGQHLNYYSHWKSSATELDSSWIRFGHSRVLQSKLSEKFWVAVRKLCNFQYLDSSDPVDRFASIIKSEKFSISKEYYFHILFPQILRFT